MRAIRADRNDAPTALWTCRVVLPHLLAVLIFCGCARKGPLLAPEEAVPYPVTDLKASYVGGAVVLEWTRPRSHRGDLRAENLRSFRVERACGVAPVSFSTLFRVDLTAKVRLQFQRRFRFVDRPPKELLPCVYRIISEGHYGHVSEPSNTVWVQNEESLSAE